MSALFFKEKITVQKLLALVLAFFGCIFASGFTGGDISVFALIAGIGSGFGYATYSIFGKVALKKYNAFTVVFYTFIVAAIGLLPFSDVPAMTSIIISNFYNVLIALGLGIISTLVPFILYTTGLKYVDSGKASVMAFAEPMVAAIAGIMIFDESLHLSNIIGMLLIFTAIVLLNIPMRRYD